MTKNLVFHSPKIEIEITFKIQAIKSTLVKEHIKYTTFIKPLIKKLTSIHF